MAKIAENVKRSTSTSEIWHETLRRADDADSKNAESSKEHGGLLRLLSKKAQQSAQKDISPYSQRQSVPKTDRGTQTKQRKNQSNVNATQSPVADNNGMNTVMKTFHEEGDSKAVDSCFGETCSSPTAPVLQRAQMVRTHISHLRKSLVADDSREKKVLICSDESSKVVVSIYFTVFCDFGFRMLTDLLKIQLIT